MSTITEEILVDNAILKMALFENGVVHLAVYDKDMPVENYSVVLSVMFTREEIESAMKRGGRIGIGSELSNFARSRVFSLYSLKEKPMEVKHLKTVRYVPRIISKKKCKELLRKSRCFLNTYFVQHVRKKVVQEFENYWLSVFEFAKECTEERLQREAYRIFLQFQRLGCCYSFLLTENGCSLCDNPDILEDGTKNADIKMKRCARFDSTKNRSRSWKLFGIKLKGLNRRFIILWKSSRKYNSKIKELLENAS